MIVYIKPSAQHCTTIWQWVINRHRTGQHSQPL